MEIRNNKADEETICNSAQLAFTVGLQVEEEESAMSGGQGLPLKSFICNPKATDCRPRNC